MFTMCTACQQQEGVADFGSETLCSRCGSLREWAAVIEMIQRQLATGPVASATTGHTVTDVAADPFSQV